METLTCQNVTTISVKGPMRRILLIKKTFRLKVIKRLIHQTEMEQNLPIFKLKYSLSILSNGILWCPTVSHDVLLFPMVSHGVLFFPILPCPVLSYSILSYPILSYLILSCPVLS